MIKDDLFTQARGKISPSFIEMEFSASGSYWEHHNFKTLNPITSMRQDNKIDSFSISDAGLVHDFCHADCPGDVIGLIAARDNITPLEAAKYILSKSGYVTPGLSVVRQESKYWEGFQCLENGRLGAPELETSWHQNNFGPEVERWSFEGQDNTIRMWIVRFHKKGERKADRPFTLWTNGEVTKWRCCALPGPYPLYNLTSLLNKKESAVLVCEGQKAASRVKDLDLNCIVTAWYGGAGSWNKTDWEPLRGREVYLWPDNDQEGVKAMDALAEHLYLLDCRVRIVKPPRDVDQGWDLADAIIDGWSTDQIISYIINAQDLGTRALKKIKDDTELQERIESVKMPQASDTENSKFFLHFYGDKIMWCNLWNKWVIWNGGFWEPDDLCRVQGFAQNTIKIMKQKAKTLQDSEQRIYYVKWALKTEDMKKLQNMVNCAKHEVAIRPTEFDSDIWKLNCLNGTVDLRTGKLYDHRPDDNMTRACSVLYDAEAKCPQWLTFLHDIMLGRQDIVEYLQRVIGYCLTGNVEERCFWIAHGHLGTNGKSTFVETITFILSDYAKTAEPQTILKRGDDNGPRNDIARLQSARFVTVSETGKGKHLDENTIKQMSGADRLVARYLYSETFEFNPQFKIFLITNHLPRISVDDPALWNRVKRIPFDYRVPDNQIDKKLKEKLRAEAPGILAWAVQGCLKWQRDGLNDPIDVVQATNEYRSGEDTVKQFLDAVCHVDLENKNISINGNVLLENYHKWSGNTKMYSRTFYEALETHGIERDRRRDGIYLKGIGLLSEYDDMPLTKQNIPATPAVDALKKAGLV